MSYNFIKIEKKWQNYWLENKVFKADTFFNNDVGLVLQYLRPKLNKNISSSEWIDSIRKKKKIVPRIDGDGDWTFASSYTSY